MAKSDVLDTLLDYLGVERLGETKLFNPQFERWREHIDFCLEKRNYNANKREQRRHIFQKIRDVDIKRYRMEPAKSLYDACMTHARLHSNSLDKPKTIHLTHPFYLSLSHTKYLKNRNVNEEAKANVSETIDLLTSPNKQANIVLAETVHHYAALTSLLLEQNVIDRVYFTEFDTGEPMNAANLYLFSDKDIYATGSYNGRCFQESLKAFDKTIGAPKIIKETVLNAPFEASTLKPRRILYSNKIAKEEDMISIYALKEMILSEYKPTPQA